MSVPSTQRRGLGAVWLVVASGLSSQVGSVLAKQTFAIVTPIAALWLRLTGGAVVLLLARLAQGLRAGVRGEAQPRGRRNWRDGLLYAVSMVCMNGSIYQAFSRMPVGLAVTVEFLGPLAVGVIGSRNRRDLLWPVLALAGVSMLGFTPSRPSALAVLFALLAATSWAVFIVAAKRVGRSWSALDALLFAAVLGSVASAVPAFAQSGPALHRPHTLLVGLGVGLLSTALPYALELVALRTLDTRVFGILMSLEPAVAALAALVLLGERLGLLDLVAMACVVVASIGATRRA